MAALRTRACERLDCRAMAKVCHSCGKGPAFGQSRSHSMVATKRRFDPNLQKVRILVGKAPRRVYVCTRCLKAGKVTEGPLSAAAPRRLGRRVSTPRRAVAWLAQRRSGSSRIVHGGSVPGEADRRVAVTDTNLVRFRARRGGRARASGIAPRGGQRPQRVPGRRRRHGRQHGADAARRAGRARPPAGRRRAAHDRRDRARGDRPVGRARGAARSARQLRRDPLAADPRRGRGARQPARAS